MDNRAKVFGLMVGCPFTNPKDDCILNQYRHLSNIEKVYAIEMMDEEEIHQILNHHCNCSKERKNNKS